MSLKGVHLVFIVLSIALTIMMGMWGISMFRSPLGSAGHVVLAALSLVSAGGLTIYAIFFVRKARRIGLR